MKKLIDQIRKQADEKSTLPLRVFYAFKFQRRIIEAGLFRLIDYDNYLKG
jgi:hypothetical protein